MTRIAVVFRRLGPYHHARLKASGRVMEVTGIELTGCDKVYAWDKVKGAEGFRRVSLFPEEDIEAIPAKTFFGRLTQELTNANPEVVVVPGWSERGALAALQWCASRHVPAVMMSESTEWDERRSGWKEWMKSRAVRLCAAALVGGRAHADYLEQLGIERNRIFFGYDAVDNDYFEEKAAKWQKLKAEIGNQPGEVVEDFTGQGKQPGAVASPLEYGKDSTGQGQVKYKEDFTGQGLHGPGKAENRKKFGLPEKYFLASARFVEKKNLPRLIEAYARYREIASKAENGKQKAEIWDLVLLGDGPLRETLNSQLLARDLSESTLNLQSHVHLPGFKQYGELPIYYGLANAFIHASITEPWGLVVNEAMASGLPVLVSNRCGCAPDLVQEGVNGFTFDPYDVEQLAQLMLKISAFNFPLSAFGSASREIISAWGPERFAKGLQQAVECALRVGPVKPTLLQGMILKALLAR